MTTILLDFPNTTGWSAIGGGASGLNAPETDYFVQGSNCISKNAWASALKGMIYNFGTISIPTDGCVMLWVNHATMNSVAAQASGGLRVILGTGTSDYDHWYVGGSDTEVFGLHNPYPVNDTVTADATTGSPGATPTHIGALANLPSGGPTKGSPFAIDAMRYGRGRVDITNGEASDYARFDDLESVGNAVSARWGNIELIKGTYLIQGFFSFGTSGTAVDFRDSNKTLNWRDTLRVTAAFNRWELINASSNMELTNITVRALGTTSKGTFVQTAGTLAWLGCTFEGWNTFTFLAAANADIAGTTFRGCDQLTCPGTDMVGVAVDDYQGAANTSAVVWDVATDPDGLMDGCEFTANGSVLSHAIEFGLNSPLEMTLRDMVFTGYSATNNVNDSVLHIKRTSGTVTINAVDCVGTVSYRSDGATVNVVVSPRTFTVNNLGSGDRVVWIRKSDEVALENKAETSGVASYSYTYGGSDVPIWVQILSVDRRVELLDATLTDADATLSAPSRTDLFYSNPA